MAGFRVRDFIIEGRFEISLDDSEEHLVVWLAQEESDDGIDWVLSRVEIASRGGAFSKPLTMARIRTLPLSNIAAIARLKLLEWEKQVRAEAQR